MKNDLHSISFLMVKSISFYLDSLRKQSQQKLNRDSQKQKINTRCSAIMLKVRTHFYKKRIILALKGGSGGLKGVWGLTRWWTANFSKISIVWAMFWAFLVWNHENRLRVFVFQGENTFWGPQGAIGGPQRSPRWWAVYSSKMSIVWATLWVFLVWNHRDRRQVYVFQWEYISWAPQGVTGGPKGCQGDGQHILSKYPLYE